MNIDRYFIWHLNFTQLIDVGNKMRYNKLHKMVDTPISNIYPPQRFIRCNFHLHFDSDRKVANQQSFANEIIYFVLFLFLLRCTLFSESRFLDKIPGGRFRYKICNYSVVA